MSSRGQRATITASRCPMSSFPPPEVTEAEGEHEHDIDGHHGERLTGSYRHTLAGCYHYTPGVGVGEAGWFGAAARRRLMTPTTTRSGSVFCVDFRSWDG